MKTQTKLKTLVKNLSIILIQFLFLVSAFPTEAGEIEKQIPRAEHPKPQFYRETWMNLNGEWDFAFDFGVSGIEKEWQENPSTFNQKIVVPFCPESKLSGIEYTDFIPAIWYHRTFTLPREWDGKRIFLHFGGVDYDCRAWINGKLVGRHYGGTVSFSFEITDALRNGENNLVVCALDDVRSDVQPSGKQSTKLKPYGVVYTRITGIWQTVWIEACSQSFIESVRIIPDLDNGSFTLIPVVKNYHRNLEFHAALFSADGKKISSVRSSSGSGVPVKLEIKESHPWSPTDPYLYNLYFELLDGKKIIDSVKSYAGLRKFHIEDNCFYLNNKPIFLRFVLDQGFYPEGIWTAPSDAELKGDIERSLAVGFNGARLHQKVFEERFHYWADRLGYLTWGEFSDWGGTSSFGNPQGVHNIQREWCEVVMRDLNHPSIVAWTPYNETSHGAAENPEAYRRAIKETVALTRALDPTRPINDASGYVHIETDIFTVHDYTHDLQQFRERYGSISPDNYRSFFINIPERSVSYKGQPYVVDEYGGTFWTKDYVSIGQSKNNRSTWGFRKTAEQVEEMIGNLTETLTSNPNIAGFTYTQLTDIEQEVNGIYTYDRKLKFNANRLKKFFRAPAAIEKQKK